MLAQQLSMFFVMFGQYSFIRYFFWKYLLTVCGLSHLTLDSTFWRAEVSHFNKFQLINYFSGIILLVSYQSKSHHNKYRSFIFSLYHLKGLYIWFSILNFALLLLLLLLLFCYYFNRRKSCGSGRICWKAFLCLTT